MFGGHGKVGGGKKKRAKRKASSMDESVDGIESIRSGSSCSLKKMGEIDEKISAVGSSEDLTKQSGGDEDAASGSMLPLCGLEDDERMLSFLQSEHRGNFQRAKLSTIVSIDRGYGEILMMQLKSCRNIWFTSCVLTHNLCLLTHRCT